MGKLNITSNITFLYFDQLEQAKAFFTQTLGLEAVYDPGWACVYRLGPKAFLGAVDNAQGSIRVASKDGVLVSITVNNIEEARAHIVSRGVEGVSEIKAVKDIDLKSFFFTGPKGYRFEIEQFTTGALSELF